MIKSINSIIGIGRFDEFNCRVLLNRSQVIFGFNGSGKTTLSDIFYSLDATNDKSENSLSNRKTLATAEGIDPKDMYVSLSSDNGELIFSNSKWNQKSSIAVFNDQYIDDYLFISFNHDIGGNEVAFGRKATSLYNQKQQIEAESIKLLESINSAIINHPELFDQLKLGKAKLKTTNPSNSRIKKISEVAIYKEAQKKIIQSDFQDDIELDSKMKTIQKWIEELKKDARFTDLNDVSVIRCLSSLLLHEPKVTDNEIAQHIQKYMSHKDLSWLSKGAIYQVTSEKCPFCGQKIESAEYLRFVKKLKKYIESAQKKKADELAKKIERAMPYFDTVIILDLFTALKGILSEDETENILRNATKKLIKNLLLASELDAECIEALRNKLSQKAYNPYESIILSEEEKKIVKTILNILRKLSRLQEILLGEKERLRTRIKNRNDLQFKRALFSLAFEAENESARIAVQSAKEYFVKKNQLDKIQIEIDNIVETKHLAEINSTLRELNVNFSVAVEDAKYKIQINGYAPTDYSKENKTLCSEGERRMLAFAYFLQEVKEADYNTIVIDDPISSLDLNRKSIVAFWIVDLMKNKDNQVIVLSHDISFVEKIQELAKTISDIGYLEIKKDKQTPFVPLDIKSFLMTDVDTYSEIIKKGENEQHDYSKITALMAIRPYLAVYVNNNLLDPRYIEIEKRSTYFSHSIYSRSSRITWKRDSYSIRSLRSLCKRVSRYTKLQIDANKIVPNNFVFNGFDYNNAWSIYTSIDLNTSIYHMRLKGLMYRVILEVTLYKLVKKRTFDPEHIGAEYNKAIKGATGETKQMCTKLKELYDLSKKYHHGAESGSSLGLSALNPDEMAFFDLEINRIRDWISLHPEKCNPNA